MGRGLSDLQKWMLRAALENRRAGQGAGKPSPILKAYGKDGGSGSGADLYYAEVKRDYFSFLPMGDADVRKNIGHHKFDPDFEAQHGDNYNSASASISRAVNRLWKRGLVIVVNGVYSHWTGIDLTEAGIAVAEKLPAVVYYASRRMGWLIRKDHPADRNQMPTVIRPKSNLPPTE